jgi:hypothetical protein
MYREEGIKGDSGWRFFCGDEEQEYTDNPDNIAIYDIQTILDIDKSILPYLNSVSGVAYERLDENDTFRLSTEYGFSSEKV